TPLMKAAVNGNTGAVNMLIEYGADLNATDKDGLTAAMLACESGRYEAAKALLDAGVDVNIKDKAGENLLDHARKFGHDHIVALLRQYMTVNETAQ
ncbi:MAG: ankyrin repeat domain-containing protein, partial [Mucispirillum sp.]|nr:ankyrin repeat domain-containing protein [Mucispirillum sp.]